MKIILISYLVLKLSKVTDADEFNLESDNSLNSSDSEIFKRLLNNSLETANNTANYKSEFFNSNILKCKNPDAFLTVPQLIKKYGYPVEIHTVQTPDGYLLELHRLPRNGATPVLLVHGVLDSSAGWVIMGPQKALAYILYDLGYDVWLGNCRGNTYSRNHVFLSIGSREFWNFSFHEMGVYDLPEMFDHILTKTDKSKLHYVSHSQGSTIFFIMCHHRQHYCEKTITMNALSPVAFLDHMRSPLIKGLSKILYPLETLSKIFGIKEILPSNTIMKLGGQIMCNKKSLTQALCTNLVFVVCGYDSEQLNLTMLPSIMGHIPAGSSVKQLVHFGQIVRSGRFQMYDYGRLKNILIYGQFRPPLYDLSKVTANITMHYSTNDWISDERDVLRLHNVLQNTSAKYLIPSPKFNHMDFLLAMNAKQMVYDQVIAVIKMSENNKNIV